MNHVSGEGVSVLSDELLSRIDALTDEEKSIRAAANKEIDEIQAEAESRMNAIRDEAKIRLSAIATKLAAYNRAWELESGYVPLPANNSKMGCIRHCIQASGSKGVTYRDIAKALDDSGFHGLNNYRYTVVGRWRKEGKVTERGGKIYWATPPTAK